MDTVIGLGSAGCNIAALFEKYPQYDVYKIDIGIKGENCFELDEKNSPEDYERTCPDLSSFLRHVTGDVLFVVAGGGYVSGASLRILQVIQNCNINVLYIKPNEQDLNRTSQLQERLTFNVFQQYARSGLFKTLYIVKNDDVEDVIGDVSILDRNLKINEYIVGLFHYLNVFANTDAVVDNYEVPKQAARIATVGIYNMQNEEEKTLFPLEHISDKIYYYAINENLLRTDGKLLRKIREHQSTTGVNPSYQIHSTKHPNSFCYFVAYSKVIQGLDNSTS